MEFCIKLTTKDLSFDANQRAARTLRPGRLSMEFSTTDLMLVGEYSSAGPTLAYDALSTNLASDG